MAFGDTKCRCGVFANKVYHGSSTSTLLSVGNHRLVPEQGWFQLGVRVISALYTCVWHGLRVPEIACFKVSGCLVGREGPSACFLRNALEN